MNIEFDSYKQKLNDCRPALEGLAESLNLEGLRNELERLHAMQEAPGFWDDPEKSQKIVKQVKVTEYKVERYEKSRKPLKTKAFGVVSWRRKRDLNPRPHA